MNLSTIIEALINSGATPAMILAAVRADEKNKEEAALIRKERTRLKVRSFREKSLNNNKPVTHVTDVTVTTPPPLNGVSLLSPHTPHITLPLNLPTPSLSSEPNGSSLRLPPTKKQKINFDFQTATFSGLEAYLPAWRLACPALDLETEIARCAAWLLENPENKKSNYARFIGNWIRKEQDRAGRVRTSGAGYQMPMSFDEKRRAHNTEVLERVRKKYEEQSA